MKGRHNTISVYKEARDSRFKIIYSSSDWFNRDYYSIIEKEDYFIIRKHYLEIPKTAYKISSSYEFHVKSKLKVGRYKIDIDDSDEDELYIYHSTITELNKNK